MFDTLEMINKSDKMYVFISGKQSKDPRFEWIQSTAEIADSKVYLLNKTMTWYHDCMDEAMDYIRKVTEGREATIVGASSGGYAALIFAHEAGCRSVTFSPQSSIDKSFKEYHDTRWMKELDKINRTTRWPQYLDIADKVKGKQHHVHYGKGCPEDRKQAERMDVCLHAWDYNAHNLAAHIKETGQLKTELERGICGNN